MKKVFAIVLALVMLATTGGVVLAGTGNGAPNGAHYNLNIIGVPKGKTADMTGNNGHRIFVPLKGNTRILLSEGPFQVLDANGTDGPAAFQLPKPADCDAVVDPDTGDVTTPDKCTVIYTVWARPLGKPSKDGKGMTIVTCMTDPDTGEEICSTENILTVVRTKGKSKFTDVSKELLFVSADIDADGKVEHIGLFDPMFEDYFWDVTNEGLRLLQLRFYMGEAEIVW
jgi:hypothetical protein